MAESSAGRRGTSRIDGGRTCVRRLRGLSWAVLLLLSSWAATSPADDVRGAVRTGPPAWMREAYWYRVHVPSFQNGNPSNDQPGAERGGLQGLQSKLPYIKALGVNTLWITGVFNDGGARQKMRHVAAAVGPVIDDGEMASETNDPATWTFSASDRVFLQFLKNAHEQKLRVVVDAPFTAGPGMQRMTPARERRWWALTRRWMDPDANGNASDGVDGWAVAQGSMDEKTRRRWRAHIVGINPNAVLLCDSGAATGVQACGGGFDAVVRHDVAEIIRRFFAADATGFSVKTFADELTRAVDLQKRDAGSSTLLPLGTARTGRFLSVPGKQTAAPPVDPPEALPNRVRLAIAMQHFLPGAPLLDSGDEAGRIALYRMLTRLRKDLQPLRSGDYKLRLADEERQLFAFSRTVPGDEVIFAMNYGNQRRNVTMRAGKPGQLIGVLNAHLKAAVSGSKPRRRPAARDPDGILRLPVTGTRQFVNSEGEIRFRIAPRSIRIILINDQEPR